MSRPRAMPLSAAPLLAAAVVACSSSSTTVSDRFVGTWQCTDTTNLSFTMPSGAPAVQESAGGTLTIVDDGGNVMTATSSTDAGVTCTLRYSVAGNSASLLAGQSCASGGLTVAYSSKTLGLDANTMTGNASFSFTGTIEVDGGAQSVAGTGSSSTTCTRQ